MNLKDKPCYPVTFNNTEISCEGLTFRERLIIALAGNPKIVELFVPYQENAERVLSQADVIIKQLEAEE